MKRYIRKRFLIALVVLGTVVVSVWLALRVLVDPEAVRAKAVTTLSELTGLNVRIDRATFDPLLGVRIEDLVLSTRDGSGRETVVARVPSAKMMHHPRSLLNRTITYSYIDIRDAEVHIERTADGVFNIAPVLEALRTRRSRDDTIPTITLDRARIYYTDHLLTDDDGRPLSMDFRNVSISLRAAKSGSRTFAVDLSMNDPDLGRWTTRDGEFDTATGTFSIKAKSSVIALSESLGKRLTGGFGRIWERFDPCGGTASVSGRFTYDRGAVRPVDFDIRADFDGATASYWRFPYRFSDVSGTLACRPTRIDLLNLRGRAGPAPVTFEGTVGGYHHGASVDMRIEGKGVPLDAKLRGAFTQDHQQTWDNFNPRGRADVICKLDREGPVGERIRVRVLAANTPATPVTTAYRCFSYPLTLEGCVFYDDGEMTIVEKPVSTEVLAGFTPGVLAARHDRTVLEVRGGTSRGTPHARVKLDFRLAAGRSLPLDDDLKQALPPAMRQIWDYLNLTGSTSGTCRVERTDPLEPQVDVALELTDIRSKVRCRDFPYELRDPEGSVCYERSAARFPGGRLLVRNLSTGRGDSLVQINGEISGFRPEGPVEKMDLVIQAANLPLNEEVRRAVPARFATLWDKLSPGPKSRVNVECRLERDHPDMTCPDLTLKIDSIDSSVTCSYFPYPVEHVRGTVEYMRNERFPEGHVRLEDLRCRSGDSPITVRGLLAGLAEGKGVDSVHVIVEAKEVPLDDKLRSALSEKQCRALDTFRVDGLADVSCTVKRTSRTERLSTELIVTPLGASVCDERFPVRLTNVAGRITVADGVVKLTKIRGSGAGGVVTLDGVLCSTDGRSGPDFTVSGKDITLGPEIEAALPKEYYRLWAKLAPRGKATFEVTVTGDGEDDDPKRVKYSGTLEPEEMSLQLGLKLADLSGVIQVRGTVGKGGHDFSGRAEFPTALVRGTRFTQVLGSFEKHGDVFSVYSVKARVYGGEAAAQLRMQLRDVLTYGIVADVRSLDLKQFLQAEFNTRTDQLRGRLSGKLLLQGQGTDAGNLVGQAEMQVRQGSLWEIPFVLALLKVLNLSPPERTAFTDATAKLEFYNRHVDVKHLNLMGNAVSVYGEGRVKRGGAVDLNFVTGLGRLRLPELPLISPVMRGIQKQILQVKMTGTLREPKLEVVPIAPVTTPVKDIVDNIAGPEKVVKKPQ
ncbi:MAG TPA: AsmA-like C-terminal region-containing protein [Planctomycetota bacterium]|nr:AsmA-like C-terminal region-containing protein [Planctomycetota bacterium]